MSDNIIEAQAEEIPVLIPEILPETDLEIGDLCIAWDFEPSENRADRYVIGRVEDIVYEKGFYVVAVEYDSTGMKREEVTPAIRLMLTEWAGRLRKLDK